MTSPPGIVPTVCPCDSGQPYAACCQPLHDGTIAGTALALMRSRYSAFALGLDDHLIRTWHPRTRPADLVLDPAVLWERLVIHRTEDGVAGDSTGLVEFTAHHSGPGGAATLHEVSRFAWRANRWLYLDGVVD